MLAYMLLFPYCCMYVITFMHDLGHLKYICALVSVKVCIYSLFFVSIVLFLCFVFVLTNVCSSRAPPVPSAPTLPSRSCCPHASPAPTLLLLSWLRSFFFSCSHAPPIPLLRRSPHAPPAPMIPRAPPALMICPRSCSHAPLALLLSHALTLNLNLIRCPIRC